MPRDYLPQPLRQLTLKRARGCCEYCLLDNSCSPEQHQIDHILALKHGGRTVSENLAYSCADCNRRKGTDFAAIDPLSGAITPLFNPRTQQWREHFALNGPEIVGLTITGQATIELLQLNNYDRLLERKRLIMVDSYPPAWLK